MLTGTEKEEDAKEIDDGLSEPGDATAMLNLVDQIFEHIAPDGSLAPDPVVRVSA